MKFINFDLFLPLFLLFPQIFKVKIQLKIFFLLNYESTFNISKAFSWTYEVLVCIFFMYLEFPKFT
jgi:hypothetical protein